MALVANGSAPVGLLDDYVVERRDQAETIVRESVRMGGIICTTDPEEAALRDELLKINGHRMGVARTSWPLRTGTMRDDSAAGTLALQARVGVDGVIAMLDDVSEPGRFMIVGADDDPLDGLDPALGSAWRSLGGLCVHFGTNGLLDIDGKYGRWFDTLYARVALIRADFHVFGTSSGDAKSTNLLVADLVRRVTHRKD